MTDKDIRKEIEENNQRQAEAKAREEDDGTLVDTAEQVLDPITRAIGKDYDEEQEAANRRLAENDKDQRSG